MKAFEPAYSKEALNALLMAGAMQRACARRAVEHLCRYPRREGDYSETGGELQVLLLDGALLTYRVDDAVCEVRIAMIEWPD